ncbi:MAG TPA: hypothetical protein VMT03_21435 [Polyangia bacterium]|nr:hypothetical protein [Polyangia bacterium]
MNRASRWIAGSSIWLGVASMGAGCYVGPAVPPPDTAAVAVSADGTTYPSAPPPDPIPEYPPPSPGWGYTWIAGYWDWGGYDWSWEPGYWAPQDAAYAYIGPRFVFVDGRPVYYRPYWRGPGGRVVYGYGPRGVPPASFRARPSVAPQAWRAEPVHNGGWRGSPGAGAYRAAPAGRAAPMGRPGGAPGGFHSAPPAARSAPVRVPPASHGGGGGHHK